MSQADEVESSTDEKKYVGPRPLARWEEDDDGYKNVHVDEFLMEDRLNMAVEQISKMIDFYDLRKGIKTDENAWPMRMKGYYQLLLALLRLEHEMDPDFAWYEKRMSFDNGYGASIICKPISYGGDAKKFEIAVLKFGEICYDTPVSYDLEGYLDFEDVIEVLHEIRELPPAEKDDAKHGYVHWTESWNKMKKRMEEDKQNGREERRHERFKKYMEEKHPYEEWKQQLEAEVAKKKKNKKKKQKKQNNANSYEVPHSIMT